MNLKMVHNGFILRMVCHYLDWDYTFNNYIVDKLYPKIIELKSIALVYYLGILTVNGYRQFKDDESVNSLFELLHKILHWNDECSVVSYMFLKQFYSDDILSFSTSSVFEDLKFDENFIKNLVLF